MINTTVKATIKWLENGKVLREGEIEGSTKENLLNSIATVADYNRNFNPIETAIVILDGEEYEF